MHRKKILLIIASVLIALIGVFLFLYFFNSEDENGSDINNAVEDSQETEDGQQGEETDNQSYDGDTTEGTDQAPQNEEPSNSIEGSQKFDNAPTP